MAATPLRPTDKKLISTWDDQVLLQARDGKGTVLRVFFFLKSKSFVLLHYALPFILQPQHVFKIPNTLPATEKLIVKVMQGSIVRVCSN